MGEEEERGWYERGTLPLEMGLLWTAGLSITTTRRPLILLHSLSLILGWKERRREGERMRERERERERERDYAYIREREREREIMPMSERERERERLCLCQREKEGERERGGGQRGRHTERRAGMAGVNYKRVKTRIVASVEGLALAMKMHGSCAEWKNERRGWGRKTKNDEDYFLVA